MPVGVVDVVGAGTFPVGWVRMSGSHAVDVDESILGKGGGVELGRSTPSRKPTRRLVAEAPVTVVDEHLERMARVPEDVQPMTRSRRSSEFSRLRMIESARPWAPFGGAGSAPDAPRSSRVRVQENLGVGTAPALPSTRSGDPSPSRPAKALAEKPPFASLVALGRAQRVGLKTRLTFRRTTGPAGTSARGLENNPRHATPRKRSIAPSPSTSAAAAVCTAFDRIRSSALSSSRPAPPPCSTAAVRRASGGRCWRARGNEHVEHAVAVEVRDHHVARVGDRGASERRLGLLITLRRSIRTAT